MNDRYARLALVADNPVMYNERLRRLAIQDAENRKSTMARSESDRKAFAKYVRGIFG